MVLSGCNLEGGSSGGWAAQQRQEVKVNGAESVKVLEMGTLDIIHTDPKFS